MKNLIVLIVLLLLGVVAFGFYRGWFTKVTSRSDNKTNVNLTVDREKIKDDMDSLKKRTNAAPSSKPPEPLPK